MSEPTRRVMVSTEPMESMPRSDAIADSVLAVGDRVWFRSGLYGDHRNRTTWGRVTAGPRRMAFADAPSWLVLGERYPGCDADALLFTEGVWMGRLRRAAESDGLLPDGDEETDHA